MKWIKKKSLIWLIQSLKTSEKVEKILNLGHTDTPIL